jgi:hypothetical protein
MAALNDSSIIIILITLIVVVGAWKLVKKRKAK